MDVRNKILIGSLVVACSCICCFSFSYINKNNFFKAEDVIHTVTIDPTTNYLPETNGDFELVNEVGTTVNCTVRCGVTGTILYENKNGHLWLTGLDENDTSYEMTFKINGIVSFDLNFAYNDGEWDGLTASMYRGNTIYGSSSIRNIHLTDPDGLSTKGVVRIPVRYHNYFYFESIVVKYSESKCRELSAK